MTAPPQDARTPAPVPSTDRALDEISLSWLGSFVDRLLIMWAVIGAMALAVSVSRASFTGWLPIYTGQVVVLSITLAVTLFRARFTPTFKAGYAIVSNLLVGITGTYTLGLMSGGVWFFPVAILLLALFVARRVAMWLTVGIFVYMIAVGAGHVTGYLRLPADPAVIATSPQQWAVYLIAAAFFFVSLMLMVNNYRREMGALYAEVVRQKDEIARLADFDSLTGLPVARIADDRLGQACLRAERAGTEAALLFIDLDGFKEVNDAGGHAAGDYCLRVVARRLRDAVRGEDTVARYGGDEFVVVMNDTKGRTGAAELAGKLVAAVAAPVEYGGLPLKVGASIGIALFPHDGRDADTLVRRADQAMYDVKRKGKNAFGFSGDAEPGA